MSRVLRMHYVLAGMVTIGLCICTSGFAAADASSSAKHFTVGVKVHFTHGQGPTKEMLSLMRQGGVTSLYEDMYWVAIEQKKGEYQMPYQAFVDESLAAGVEPVLVLCYWNPFYNEGGSPVTDESREGFAKYCEYVVGHFKGRVRQYEVWNEWGGYLGGFSPGVPAVGQTIENYVKLIRHVYPRIKAVDPTCEVHGGWMIDGYLDELIQRGGLKYLDAVSIHAYPFNAGAQRYSPEGWIDWMQQANAKLAKGSPNKKVPFYVTEAAWPTHILADGTPPEKTLSYAARMYLLGRTVERLKGIYWYDFQNDYGFDPRNQEANFGLIDLDFMPKPAWFGLRDVADLVETGEYLGRIETNDPKLWVMKFKRRDGKDVLAIWNTTSDDLRCVVLKTKNASPAPVEFQKVGHAPVVRSWGSFARFEGESFIADQLFVSVGETPWLIIGDLSDVTVLPEVRVRPMPESARPTNMKIHLPKAVTFASPDSAKAHEVSFDVADAIAICELDTFAEVKGWGISGQNNGVRTGVRHVNKPAVTSDGAMELTYDFRGEVNRINSCTYTKPMAMPAGATKVSFRLSGDGSGHMVWILLTDKTGERFAWCVAGVPGKEWMTVSLDLSRPADSHWDGNNDGKLDLPLQFSSFTIESNDRPKAAHGKVWIDELVVDRTIAPDKSVPTFVASWDASSIHLTITVPDAKHVSHDEDSALWKGDSVQVAIQALPENGPLPRAFSEYTAAQTADGPKLYRHSSQRGEPNGLIKDVPLTIDRKDNITIYQLTLPASELGIGTLKAGMAIPMTLVVNKNDGADRSYMEWGGGVAGSKNPMDYNWLMLCPF